MILRTNIMTNKKYKERQQIINKIFLSKKKFHKSMAKLSFENKLIKLSELREFVKHLKG